MIQVSVQHAQPAQIGLGEGIGLARTIYIHIYQGCVIRSFGTFNTVKHALNTEYAYDTIVFLRNFGSADF